MRFLKVFSVLAMLSTAGCSTNPATGQQSFTAFMSEADEIRVGAEEHPKIVKQFGGEYLDRPLNAYIRNIGKKLAAISEVPNLPYRFTILNDERVNAFAVPGGYVYITRGLLALAEDEAEVAGVLAHEIGHITARHTAQRYSTTMATNIGLTVIGVIGSAAGLPSGLGRIASVGAQAAIQGYSRQQELEADMLGVRYMTRMGYDPNAMTSFFEKLDAHSTLEATLQGKDGVSHNIMSTHPRTADRITQAIQLAKAKSVANPRRGRNEYLERIDGMVFGDDIAQGVRKGRSFIHPDLRFRFDVPPRFVLFNSPSQVVARGPDSSKIVFDMAKRKNAARAPSLEAYLTGTWGRNLSLSEVENIDINGAPAATGSTRLDTSVGDRDVRLLVVRGGADQIFRFAFITRPEMTAKLNTEFRRTTYSFRRLSEKEAAAIKPLRIKLVTVKPGDTVAKLAETMPFEKYKREWFRVLNALDKGESLTPRRHVKLVTDQ